MKCGYCGKILKDDAQFCSNCGRNLQEIDEDPSVSDNASKKAYAFSIFALLLVITIVALGAYVIIQRDLQHKAVVTESDEGNYRFNYDSTFTDAALVGKWRCTDRAAADYTDKNFGVEVSILLELTGDGRFTLDYTMTDTGVEAKTLNISGTYSTEDGTVTFIPEEIPGISGFLKRHGKRPAFPYSVGKGKFSLKYENGSKIVFKQVKE